MQVQFNATDLRNRTVKEKRQALGAKVEDVKKKRRRALKRGLSTAQHGADLKGLRAQIAVLEGGYDGPVFPSLLVEGGGALGVEPNKHIRDPISRC